ncbi:ATP-binding protein [Pleionea sediminis]|uniref:ATP-binding protein n=1 Tax=Pleionea sediminis TaxID=2569479 RepID=UPI0011849266|nr:ATP-binding protein [Pleionea sediminis]
MNKDTVKGLMKAFHEAPSGELARIIVSSLVELNEPKEAVSFYNNSESLFTSSTKLSIADLMIQKELHEFALVFLDTSLAGHLIKRAECYLWLEQLEEAKSAYQQAVAQDDSLVSAVLARQLGLMNTEQERPKLKVVEKSDVASITDLNRYKQETTDFSDVVGLADIKKQINKKIILPFQKPSLFQKFKKKVGGGVLLYGPPGCGKTLLARATAGECKAKFFNIEISDVLDMYIGESEQKLHAIFEKAREDTPSVLFFDEIEALAGKREHSRNSSTANIVSQFLTELDGFAQNNHGVLVLASTNVPWAVDAAFLRPGRFDRMFFVPPPDRSARQAILEHHMKDRPCESGIKYGAIAEKAKGFSGADLHNLVEMAADEAIDEAIESGEDSVITQQHFSEALKDSRATTIEWLTTARNYARYANDGGRYDDVLNFLKKHGR